jgi:hypothetical protein
MPLFILWAIGYLTFDIYVEVNSSSVFDVDAFNLASVIVDGTLIVTITEVLILTMKIPGANWTPALVPLAPGQPYTTNAGWGQPVYNPHQQSQFYPAPHPLFQQVQMQQQQQQYPYSSVPQPVPSQAVFNQLSPPIPNQPGVHPPVSA